MSGLVGVELTRFRARRAILVLVLAAVVVSGVFAAKTAWDTRPISASDLATARAQAEIASQQDSVQSELRRCQAKPEEYLGAGSTSAGCAEAILPRAASFLNREPLRIAEVARDQSVALALLVIILMVLAGATFAGSDWASGSIGTQLLFEPRRTRLWAAKAVAVALGSLLAGAVALAVFWVPIGVLALERDVSTTSAVWQHLAWHLVRALVLVALVPVLAYGLTMLFRHTVATLGLLFGVTLGAEILLGLLPFSGSGRFSPSHNALAWLRGSTRYFDPSLTCKSSEGECSQLRTLHLWPAGGLMAVVLLIVLAVSWWSFRRRDLP